MLDDRGARHIEAFLNQARLVLVGCLLVLANTHLLPGSNNELLLALTIGGVAWVVVIALLTRYAYRPWVAIAFALGDTIFVSVLVYLTGGPTSPVEALYPILIFAAAVRLTRVHSFLLTLAVILAYVEVTWLHPSFVRAIHGNALATRSVILAATGVLGWLIAAEVARQRRAFVEAEGRIASLTLIDHVARALGEHTDVDHVCRATVELTDELLSPLAVALVARDQDRHQRVFARGLPWSEQTLAAAGDDRRDQVFRAIWDLGAVEIVATPIGPPSQPQAWLYVGPRAGEPMSAADRALVQRISEEAWGALQRAGLLQRERERAASLAVLADENRRLLDSERETVARLRQLAVHKAGFIDMIAHELRTPLTSIKGFAQLLLRGSSTPAGARYVEMILGESNRLVHIIDDIVDLSRMERGLLEMRHDLVDLRGLLDAVAASLESRPHAPRFDLADDLPTVRGDAEKLQQALLNLVSAGALYHESREPMVLGAHAEPDGHAVVRLDLVGKLPARELIQVFQHAPRGVESAPTNLSLYICKNFVEAHGGELRIEHPADGRARLAVSLPAAPGGPAGRRGARAAPHPRHRTTGARHAISPRHPPRQSQP